MNLTEVRRFARGLGVTPGRLNKVDLIRSIQRFEGNFDCFATAYAGDCDQYDCMWRQDCFAAASKSAPAATTATAKRGRTAAAA
jgi:environmental stress-induced protein Ves